MGGMKHEIGNNIGSRIWNFCIENKLWVQVVHIPVSGRPAI